MRQCARPVPLQPWKRFTLIGGATLSGVTATVSGMVALDYLARKYPESWLSKRSPGDPLFLGWIGADNYNDTNEGKDKKLRPAKEYRRLMRNSLAENVVIGALMVTGIGMAAYSWRRPALFNSRCEYAFSRAYFGITGSVATLNLYHIHSCSYPAFTTADNYLKTEQNRLRLLQSAPAIGYVAHNNEQSNPVTLTRVESSVESVVDTSTTPTPSFNDGILSEAIQLPTSKTN